MSMRGIMRKRISGLTLPHIDIVRSKTGEGGELEVRSWKSPNNPIDINEPSSLRYPFLLWASSALNIYN